MSTFVVDKTYKSIATGLLYKCIARGAELAILRRGDLPETLFHVKDFTMFTEYVPPLPPIRIRLVVSRNPQTGAFASETISEGSVNFTNPLWPEGWRRNPAFQIVSDTIITVTPGGVS